MYHFVLICLFFSLSFLKLVFKNVCFFHWKIYRIYFNCYVWYLTLPLVFCLFLLFGAMSCCLLCVCLYFALIGVLIAFIFHSNLEHRSPIFFILLVIADKFFKSHVNSYLKKYQIHEWNKNVYFHYGILRIWCVYIIPIPSSVHILAFIDITWDLDLAHYY